MDFQLRVSQLLLSSAGFRKLTFGSYEGGPFSGNAVFGELACRPRDRILSLFELARACGDSAPRNIGHGGNSELPD